MNEEVMLVFLLTNLAFCMFCLSLQMRSKLVLLYSSVLLSLTGIWLIAVLFPYYELLVASLFREEVVAMPSPFTLLIGEVCYTGGIVAITIWQMKKM